MVDLDTKYREKGLSVLAFPCNQFGYQEPWGEDEIKQWTRDKFGVDFPMFSKVNVNGDGIHPVFAFLKTCFPGDIAWNFRGKFLVNRAGIPVKRFEEKESWESIEKAIVEELAKDLEAEAKL